MHNRFMRRHGAAVLLAALLVLLVAFAAACGEEEATTTTAASTATTAAGATTSAAPTPEPQPLLVAAAASLKSAFTELGTAFDAANNSVTTFTFDASGSLQTQIEGGAPVDVFASAAWKQVNDLLEKGLVDEASTAVFASNEIVLAVPADSTLAIGSFEDLTKDEIQNMTTTDPKTSPLGQTSMEILTTLGLLDAVQPKVIYAKNASQALTYVKEGEVDAGMLFSTDAVAGGGDIRVVAVSDPSWHTEIAYVLATVSASETKTLAQMFIDFVLGPEGQAILNKHGFLSPPTS